MVGKSKLTLIAGVVRRTSLWLGCSSFGRHFEEIGLLYQDNTNDKKLLKYFERSTKNFSRILVCRALVVMMGGRQKGRKSCSGRGSLFIIVAREVLVDLGGRRPKFIALVLFGEAFEFWIFCDRNFWVPRLNLIGRFVRQSQHP